jgi:hypothetical protein
VTIAVPPGYIVEQGPMTNISIRDDARRAQLWITVVNRPEARQTYDESYYRQRQKRNACNTSLSGYPAEVVGSYNDGQFALLALWEASWGGDDAGKWLLARITGLRVEEAIALRTVLHTIRPASPN